MMGMAQIDNITFSDTAGHWAEADIQTAAAAGWVKGYPEDTFLPDQYITRAEFVTLVNRILERAPETSSDLLAGMVTFPDNADTAEWYYLDIQEAANSHDYERKGALVPGLTFQYEYWTHLLANRDWTALEKTTATP